MKTCIRSLIVAMLVSTMTGWGLTQSAFYFEDYTYAMKDTLNNKISYELKKLQVAKNELFEAAKVRNFSESTQQILLDLHGRSEVADHEFDDLKEAPNRELWEIGKGKTELALNEYHALYVTALAAIQEEQK